MRNRKSLTTGNTHLNGEYAGHVRRWLKKYTSHRRRQRNKSSLRAILEDCCQ